MGNVLEETGEIKRKRLVIGKIETYKKTGKNRKASITVEMSYILPMILFLTVFIIHIVMFYHDRTLINAAACETVEYEIEKVRNESNKNIVSGEEFFNENVGNRLLWLKVNSVGVSVGKDVVSVKVKATNGIFTSGVSVEGKVPYPEKYIRSKRKLKDIENKVQTD